MMVMPRGFALVLSSRIIIDLTNRHAQFPLSSGVLEADVWKGRSHLTSPYLVDLARTLPDVVLASKAPGTLDKYRLAWLGWKRWAARFPCVSSFPAQPLHVALYFKDLLKTAKSIAPIAAAQYGIRWAHHAAGVQSPTDHTMVQSTMEGCRRLLAKPIQPKDPLPADVFPKTVQALGGPDADIDNLRPLVLVLVGYAGFMRISELLNNIGRFFLASEYLPGYVLNSPRYSYARLYVISTWKLTLGLPLHNK